MASIDDYKQIIAVIDRTFTHHEKRLVELREETIAFMRSQLASLPTRPTPEELSGTLSSKR